MICCSYLMWKWCNFSHWKLVVFDWLDTLIITVVGIQLWVLLAKKIQNSLPLLRLWPESTLFKCVHSKIICALTITYYKYDVCQSIMYYIQWRAIQTALLPVYDVNWGHFERAKMTLKMLPASKYLKGLDLLIL